MRTGGTAWAWGRNEGGQLGDGTLTRRVLPVQVQGPMGTTALAAGESHSLGMTADGAVWAWGLNLFGQFGTGRWGFSPTPVQQG